jgi:putative two-component system hydrogenase maturation factor HypX/HoxX
MPPLRILLLTHGFNGLAQRLFVELRAAGHGVSVELDIADAVTEEAVTLAPRRGAGALPEAAHPGVGLVAPALPGGAPGARRATAGRHALDWVLEGLARLGRHRAAGGADFDAGPVWAWRAVRPARRCHQGQPVPARGERAPRWPRCEARWRAGGPAPRTTAGARAAGHARAAGGRWCRRRSGPSTGRATTPPTVLRRVRSADGARRGPTLFGQPCGCSTCTPPAPPTLAAGAAGGRVVARRGPALLVRTRDGGVWIGHVRALAAASRAALKLAATRPSRPRPRAARAGRCRCSATTTNGTNCATPNTAPQARVGWLSFDFHNGAMSERQARRLVAALAAGGATRACWCSPAAPTSSATASTCTTSRPPRHAPATARPTRRWRAIEAIDDVALAILQLTDRLTVAALRGNAGAGGCFLALAADGVGAPGVVLNPHYKNMGNLYGSEYWTYLLPRRVGEARARPLMQGRLPMAAAEARTWA